MQQRLRLEARTIRDKYISAPHTTDFGILFVPTEGLYAEALRRPGLVEAMQRETLVSPAASQEMIRFMRAQQAGARRLPHFVDVPLAHKTGDFPPVLANDVGIAFARSGPIVISFFANAITGNYGAAEDRIGRIAELVVEYFDGGR